MRHSRKPIQSIPTNVKNDFAKPQFSSTYLFFSFQICVCTLYKHTQSFHDVRYTMLTIMADSTQMDKEETRFKTKKLLLITKMKIYNTKISVPMKYDRIFLFVPFRSLLVLSLILFFFIIVTIQEKISLPTKTQCVLHAREQRKTKNQQHRMSCSCDLLMTRSIGIIPIIFCPSAKLIFFSFTHSVLFINSFLSVEKE